MRGYPGHLSAALVLCIASAACSKSDPKPAGEPPASKGADPPAGKAATPPVATAPVEPEPAAEPEPAPAAEPEPAAPAPAAEPVAAVVVEIGRRFDALEDNAAAAPPVFGENGDFLAWNDRCGLYADTASNALYVVCDGEVKSSPIRTAAEVEDVMRQVMAQRNADHDVTMDIIKNYPTGGSGKQDHYDEAGNFKGTW